ncbi:hypothetical protein Lbys_0974 [Leadbetterella byssophila DSM 17132]|uniref:Uncharacterized protein n=1 Tax=Leadbetterella byssophila (strain DSM 17132 / JCM 16389 / KACC 11308 / NBRC 106382 / 4M15) TaxID=649349 RepID=E4RRQ3_LEAB4|nr:hypothetical protein Lbys_0974 [Leadbetterella byssophila DSM 17132]
MMQISDTYLFYTATFVTEQLRMDNGRLRVKSCQFSTLNFQL